MIAGGPSFSGVRTGGCAKPQCKVRAAIHRHHKRHEALWLGAWAHRRGEPQWEYFKNRYAQFLEEDIIRLCAHHHAEIHSVYDAIIAADIARTGMKLYLYTWKQARILMNKLELACEAWLEEITPGILPESYEETKQLRRAIIDREVRGNHPASASKDESARQRARKWRRERKKKTKRK